MDTRSVKKNKKNREFSEFHHLIKDLRADEVKFKKYFQIKTETAGCEYMIDTTAM